MFPFLNTLLLGSATPVYKITGINSSSGTSVDIPPHNPGDLIIIRAIRNGGTSISNPSGYTSIFNASVPNAARAMRAGFRRATTSSETSRTWTGAGLVTALVLQNVKEVGNSNTFTRDSPGTTSTAPAVSIVGARSHVMLMNFAEIREPPSGMSVVPNTAAIAVTNQPVSSFTERTFSQASSNSLVGVFELRI